jgi:GNAT superfamily N-acetyltransferase
MSTSAERSLAGERVLRDGSVARLRAVPYDDPVARYLIEQVQQEYVQRYGGPDAAAVDPAEFLPPSGLFLVAEVAGLPAGSGAWRALGDGSAGTGVAEIKRLYVEPAFRRRGLAQVIVDALERSAAATGQTSVVLNTGDQQPEALALYAQAGYGAVAGYGMYACAPDAVFLGKTLASLDSGADGGEGSTWAS